MHMYVCVEGHLYLCRNKTYRYRDILNILTVISMGKLWFFSRLSNYSIIYDRTNFSFIIWNDIFILY